jgi:hypothetical protein
MTVRYDAPVFVVGAYGRPARLGPTSNPSADDRRRDDLGWQTDMSGTREVQACVGAATAGWTTTAGLAVGLPEMARSAIAHAA